MTIQYKNAGVSLTTSNLTTVLTITTSAVAIVKSVYFSNTSTGSILCNSSYMIHLQHLIMNSGEIVLWHLPR